MPLAGQSFEINRGNSYNQRKSQKEFEAFLAEEEAKKQASLKKLVDQTIAPLRQAAKGYALVQAPLWSRDVSELEKGWQSGNPSILIGMFWDVLLLGFEDRPPVAQGADVCETTFKEFVASLSSRGVTLSPLGEKRLALFTYIQLKVGRNKVVPENLQIYFDALLGNNCFNEGEIEGRLSAPSTPKNQNTVTVTTFEELELGSSDETARLGRDVANFLVENEAAPIAKAWLDSLEQNFGFVPTQKDLAYSVTWFRDNNRSWFDHSSYDAFRLHMLKSGRWPTSLLTLEDIRARAVDRLDMTDRDVRAIVFYGTKDALLDVMKRHAVSLI